LSIALFNAVAEESFEEGTKVPGPDQQFFLQSTEMSTIDPTDSLSDLVVKRPSAAPTLDSLGLDYCCGGSQSLTAACAEAGADLEEVVARIVASAPVEAPAEWASLSTVELVAHIEQTHHAFLKESLPRLDELVSKVADVHGHTHSELYAVKATFQELRRDLEPHLMKEERVLFPMVRQLYESEETASFHCGSLQNPIGVMLGEHDNAGELLAQLRSLTSDYVSPTDGCASYAALYAGLAELEADTHVHIHKENSVLFPAVIEREHAISAS